MGDVIRENCKDTTPHPGHAWGWRMRCEGLLALRPSELRQHKAVAWNEALETAHDSGWLHDYALSDAIGRNPYTGPRV